MNQDRAIAGALSVLLGLLIGLAGVFVARLTEPYPGGVALALATLAAGAVFSRGLAQMWGLAPFLLGAGLGIALTALAAPGGDQIWLRDGLTIAWAVGAGVVGVVVAVLPVRWFADFAMHGPEDVPDDPAGSVMSL